ncbi:hypothetical protein STAS_29395 [Striga asiatica]|uniref:Uncharacterized protein n=1 Tax=Striga asiatica TaxID=4170 RepID=A0A5A7R3P3_STRAF|nr:hypothetical protein STAS_29395 [Striga asiatica]
MISKAESTMAQQIHTLTKFPRVLVDPREEVNTSSIPANWSTFFGTRAATIPDPRGAGTIRTVTDPHFPVTLHGTYDSAADGGGDLLGALDPEADVAVAVSDHDEGLEPGPLSGPGLLLDRHDLHHLVLQGGPHQGVDDLILLNREGVEVDLLEGFDFPGLDQTAELRHRHPLLLVVVTAGAARAAAPSSPVSTAATATESAPETPFAASFSHYFE